MTNQRHRKSPSGLWTASSGGQRANAAKRSNNYYSTSRDKNQAPPLLLIPTMLQARLLGVYYAEQGFYNTSAAWLDLFYFLRRLLRGAAPTEVRR